MTADKRIGLEGKIVAITGGYGHLGSGITNDQSWRRVIKK